MVTCDAYAQRVRYPEQADPPGPVTCAVYVLVVLFLCAGIVFVALKAGGWI